MKPTTAIILDTRRPTKDNKYPLKLRVTFNRVRRYYGIDVRLSEDDWNRLHGKKPRKDILKIRANMDRIIAEVDDVIVKLTSFSFDQFEREYFKRGVKTDVVAAFKAYIEKLTEQGRIGTASSYRCAITSLCKFQESISFSDITPEFLKSYERWMLAQGNSGTSIGIYLRSLRTLVNEALHEGTITLQQYPFGKMRYQIPQGQNIKKALTIKEVQKIIKYDAVLRSPQDKARDFWLLSYYCNGANMADICRWKYKDWQEDKIIFYRRKTVNTSRSPKPIVVVVTPQVKKIIHKWAQPKKKQEDYIFPILSELSSPVDEKKIIAGFIHVINNHMDKIAKELKIGTNLTTYVARHTFSTILKRGGVPIAYISESLGHSDLRTTENYLGSFEDEQKIEFAKLLIPKKK